VELLAMARNGGYFKNRANVKSMKKDHRLDSLRRRDDFKKLLADLERKPAGEPR
jgi:hypothetical protein